MLGVLAGGLCLSQCQAWMWDDPAGPAHPEFLQRGWSRCYGGQRLLVSSKMPARASAASELQGVGGHPAVDKGHHR